MTKPYSKAAQAVIDAIFANEYASTREIAAKAIEEAAKQLIVKTNPDDYLLKLAFLALADELRNKLLSDASYQALSEEFPALVVSDSESAIGILTDIVVTDPDGSWPAGKALSLRAPIPTPVSERPWDRPGWCDDKHQCWGFNASERAWRLRHVSFFTGGANCFVWRWLLPASAIQIPAEEVQP